jgi:hypothetical protein
MRKRTNLKHIASGCPKTAKPPCRDRKYRRVRWIFPVTGFLALIWFLVRVIPKPSRATYPCQRVAFPLASGFVVWLMGTIGSVAAFRKAKHCFARSRYVVGAILLAVSVGAAFVAISGGNERTVLADNPTPNDPIGVTRGIYPGRVVWVHDQNATDWDGPDMGDGHWWDNNATDQNVADYMMSRAIRTLTGQNNGVSAWDALFRYFNQNHGKGDVGYQVGEKIMIKLNLVGLHFGWHNVDANGNHIVGTDDWGVTVSMDRIDTSPHMMLALIEELVYAAGVDPCDITVGDTVARFPNEFYDPIAAQFPGVTCIDYYGTLPGRTQPQKSASAKIYWSNGSGKNEYVPTCFAEAEYVINLACLKGHRSAGVTMCGKNNYGSLIRTPGNFWSNWDDDYLNLHASLPDSIPQMGRYRALVDLMGCQHFDGKAVLFLIDGLYGGHIETAEPSKWYMAPFNGDWPSSLFASQDEVAIDSVSFDFLWTEFDGTGDWGKPHISGADDYMHEAAEANDPCSGTLYDPNGTGAGLSSLGVHEHWNNATDKQYSRNLETGNGIELVVPLASSGDIYEDGKVDFRDFAVLASAWQSTPSDGNWDPNCDLAIPIWIINQGDLGALARDWLRGVSE